MNASIHDRARAYLARIPGAVSGAGGHKATFHVACVLVHDFGLSIEEAAISIGVSPRTVKREWAVARAWLFRELSKA